MSLMTQYTTPTIHPFLYLLPVLQAVGLSFSVPGAHSDVKEAVDAVTTRGGGEGAVREITDFILASQGNLNSQ